MIASLTGQGFDVQRACLMLGVSVSGYYAWRGRPPSAKTLRHTWLAGEIAQVHKDSGGTYGAMRVTAELRLGRGIHVGHNQIELLMRRLGLKGLPNRRPPRTARLSKGNTLDLVRRRFGAQEPDRLWMTDITEHPAREGKLYCCAVLDAFSRMVVGWSIDSSQTALLATNALGMALAQRSPSRQAIIHSDQGVQFGSWVFSQKVKDAGLAPSMGDVGTPVDSPHSEAQFKTLKYRPEFREHFDSIEHARAHCRAFLGWHNHEHRHSGIGLMTPAAFHHGHGKQLHAARAAVLEAAYAAHPERFVRKQPVPPKLPTAAWINKPKEAAAAH
ncbi:MAG TPA: IS3 family transposase [Solirubrobacteraceae bacterium]|nr:IS3 family transposase [Solirubrobacteraceae bacterium]